VIDVPAVVRAKADAAGATDWVDNLPALVASLARDWSITVGRPFTDATEAFVAEATRGDGTPAVLKVLVPRHYAAAQDEMTVLRLCGGEGCARLFEADDARDALLMERLGPSLHDLGRSIGERHAILADLAQRVWRPAPDSGLRTGAQKGRWLAEFIVEKWQQLDRPCSERTVRHALACAQRRVAAHDDERAVLVHGDVHEWNALQAAGGWKLVDPDGLLAEPEYDLGILMREDPVDLLDGDPMGRARWLAARTGCDPTATWEWGVVERVSTGLLGTEIGMQPVASQMLHTADVIAGARP
jgi:streptomycin 6-kinase